MKISYQWLKELLPDLQASPQIVADKLTLAGLEVESITQQGQGLEGVFVGQVLKKTKHPNADRLNVCVVDDGLAQHQIVCGAANVEEGGKYPVARVGATLPQGLVIKKSSIRQVESSGMLCSQTELGLASASSGLFVLDSQAKVGQNIREYLGLEDTILEIGITPNRGDCLSHWGIAKEVAALFGLEFNPWGASFPKSAAQSPVRINIENKSCVRYSAAMLKGVRVESSPSFIARRLESLGIRAINNIVDATNYIMLLTGHPLHAFDARSIPELTVTVRGSHKDEKFKALDGKERVLKEGAVLICSGQEILALGGIMGGESSQVTQTTQDILLEAASFEPDSIRVNSKYLGLSSESSYRFERGVSPDTLPDAMMSLIDLITKNAGGKLEGSVQDIYPKSIGSHEIDLSVKRLSAYTGFSWDDSEVTKVFKSLGFGLKNTTSGWKVSVPSRRFDLKIEEDLIEELVRFRGFEHLESELPRKPMSLARLSSQEEMSRLIKSYLVTQGYNEVINYSFIGEADLVPFGLDSKNTLSLANPLSEDLAIMRPTLITGLMKAYLKNKPQQNAGARYFELRRIYSQEGEHLVLGILGSGNRFDLNWKQINQETSFFELKGLLEDLLSNGFILPRYADTTKPYLHPGQSQDIVLGSDLAGSIGILHPKVLNHFDVKENIGYLELYIPVLTRLWKFKKGSIMSLSDQPSIARDLALVVPLDLSYGKIEKAILKKKINILKSFGLFDVYTGNKVPEGHKSMALNLVYGATDKTLTDEEVNLVHFDLVATLEKELGASLR